MTFVTPPVIVDRDGLVGIGHHGDQHVEEDDDVAHRVTAEHEQSRKPGNMLASSPTHLLLKVRRETCLGTCTLENQLLIELVPGEASDPLEVEVTQVNKAKACPEEGL